MVSVVQHIKGGAPSLSFNHCFAVTLVGDVHFALCFLFCDIEKKIGKRRCYKSFMYFVWRLMFLVLWTEC